MNSFHFKNRVLKLDSTKIMGILNVTPDSFSDGGNFFSPEVAVDHALKMIDDGADIIDIGGESTRPGSEIVKVEEELKRVVPVIERLRELSPDSVISIDTTKSKVAEVALKAGADIVNDVSGLMVDPLIADVVASENGGLILMHMRGTPATMQNDANLNYNDLVNDICKFLNERADYAIQRGVKKENIALDPGIGFAKKYEQNLDALHNISRLREIGFPLLVGPSRKAFIGSILDEPLAEKRVFGTVGVIAWLVFHKVEIVRVHDVLEMKQVIKVINSLSEYKGKV